jgi:hypothetical protein
MSSFKEEDTLYKAIIRRDLPAVNAFLAQGDSVPEFLYLQATNHDHLAVLQFMLNIEPEKRQYAVRLAVGQGAVVCTKFFLEKASVKDCEEIANITPRRNNEIIAQLIHSAILEKNAAVENTAVFSI